MTDSTTHPSAARQEAPGTQASLQARNAFRVAILYLVGNMVAAPVDIYLAVQTQAWQLFAIAGIAVVLCLVAAVSAWLSRRGRPSLAAQLLIDANLVIPILFAFLISGLGLVGGLAVVLVTFAIAAQTLSPKDMGRAFIASVGSGMAAGLLDLWAPASQLSVSALQTFIPALVGVLILAYSFLILRQFSSYPLTTKLILSFLAAAFIPLGVQTIVNSRATREALTHAANQALLAAAEQTANTIDTFIESNLAAIEVEAQLPALAGYLGLPADRRVGTPEEAEALDTLSTLNQKDKGRDRAGDVTSYALLDWQGRIVLDTDASNTKVGSTVGADQSERDYFHVPLSSGRPYVSPVEFSQTTAALYFSSPVRDEAGEFVGVLRVSYDATVLQELIAQTNGLAGPDSFGVLFDENQLHLAHGLAPETIFKTVAPLEPERIARLQAVGRLPDRPAAELSTNLPELARRLANASIQPYFAARDVATGTKVRPSDEVDQVAVAPVNTRQWQVAFFQPQSVFLAAADEQTRNTLVLAIVIAGVMGVAGLGLSHVLAAPISRLTGVAAQIAGGNLSAQARAETSDEIGELATTFNSMTAQMRVLIDSLELQVEARTAQLQASAEVGRAAASILDPDQLLREVVDLITGRFGFYYAAVFTLDEAGTKVRSSKFAVLRAATGEAGQALRMGGHKLEVGGPSMVGTVTVTRKPRVSPDVGREEFRFANPLLPYTRSEIALPLVVGDRVLGALDVQSTQEAAFDETSAAVLQSMADEIAIALNNAALYAESQRNVDALNRLLEMSRDITGSRTLDDLRARALKHIQSVIGIDNYYVALTDEAQTEIRFIVQVRPDFGSVDVITRPFGAGRTEYVIRTRRPLRMDAAEATLRMAHLGLKTWEQQPGAFLGVPIVIGDRVLGMIGLQDFAEDAAFSDLQERLTITLANQVGATLGNLRLAEETQRALTDLDMANRRLTGEAWTRYASAAGVVSGEWQSGQWLSIKDEGGTLRVKDEVQPLTSNLQPPTSNLQPPTSNPTGALRSLQLPIRVRGQTIGEFDLARVGEWPDWTPEDIAFAQSLVDQVGQTIETARLLQETERLAGRERIINDINSRVRRTVNLDSILKTAVNELGRSLGAARVFARIGGPSTTIGDDDRSAEGMGKGGDHV